ncbi:IQ domain-containing protein E isoform X3 [Nycticebus coucang]|uniref:IQ domain-containing protein E isoform X3 n=1 Tax=Nycticebus coucang TaxID=9470 RepID=UPI00234DE4B9|nr:IQ domain-containing protein E isoform X3 [Nycticebus coucang]
MSLGTGEPASETGDDSLSAITFDSDFETKTKRKSFHKPPPTSPKSPYHSKPRKVASWRSLRTAGNMPLGGRVSLTPQKLWLGTSKPGSLTQPLKSNLTLEHTWTNPPSSTPDYLTEALRMKRSNLRRSASNGHVPGIPVYREKEDMYDEIIELKKSLHMQKNDMDLMRTKLRRLEEENNRKDRQIEQLLDPSRGSDFVRTLAEKRPDTGWVINGLKQRILKLEQQCKEKDTTINKLQTDMKTTNLEEMRIAMETYYEEIHRLQTLLASCDTTGKKPPGEKKMSAKRQKKVNSALLNLSRSVQELTEENQSLKEDLDRVLSNSPTVSKVKAGYTEWSKPRLLRRISELEKKISSMESLKSHPSDPAKSSPLAHSASSSTVNRQLRGDRDCREEQEHLRGTLRSLKGERDALQAQLLERGLEVKQLLQIKADLEKELENMREWEKERRKQEEALKEEIQTLTNKFQELHEMEKEEKDDPMEVTHETQEELQASAPSSRHSEQDLDANLSGGWLLPSHPASIERRRDAAARTLQAQWKVYKHKKKKAILDEAAMVLQAAFKGHLARVKLLASKACDSEPPSTPSLPNQPQSSPTPRILSPIAQTEGSPGQEEAITVIQSVLRAHLARASHSKRTTTAAGTKRRPASATPKETSSPPVLAASPGKEESKASSREAVEDEDRLGESAAPGPCSVPSPSRPLVPPPVDDVNSDDSDDVVIAPPLPGVPSDHIPLSSLAVVQRSFFSTSKHIYPELWGQPGSSAKTYSLKVNYSLPITCEELPYQEPAPHQPPHPLPASAPTLASSRPSRCALLCPLKERAMRQANPISATKFSLLKAQDTQVPR